MILSLAPGANGAFAQANRFEAGVAAYQSGNYARAFRIWQPLAQKGDVLAQFNLGILYNNGQGVDQDYGRAATWFQNAALQKYPPAILQTGIAWYAGQGVKADHALALLALHEAQSRGEKDAAAWITRVYEALFPEPLAGWQAGPVQVSKKEFPMPGVFELMGTLYQITFARTYEKGGSEDKVGVEITMNDMSEVEVLIDWLNAAPGTLDDVKRKAVDGLRKNGMLPYRSMGKSGLVLNDVQGRPRSIGLKLSKSVLIGFEFRGGERGSTLVEDYLRRTDLPHISGTLDDYDQAFTLGPLPAMKWGEDRASWRKLEGAIAKALKEGPRR